MRTLCAWMGVILAFAGTGIAGAAPGPLDVHLNEMQVLGTHNSYHIQPEDRILTVLELFEPGLPATLEYTHVPLTQQFDERAIRHVELDVFADPNGGHYAQRQALAFFGEDPNSGIPELDLPGFKVLHVQDIDFESTCFTLVACLGEVKAWSDTHPAHLPIMILIEAKDDPIPDPINLGFAIPIPIGPAELDALDAEIRSVFTEDRLITPDDIRGSRPTLEEAILRDGWPTIRALRGQVLFALDNGGAIRDAYVAGHPSLTGRVLFTNSARGTPEAAFLKLNDPIAAQPEIIEAARKGYLIRTRADADTLDARAGDTTRRDAALASGAQFVSTDYPVPDPFGMGYVVAIPGGSPARCNPVNAPRKCQSSALENLSGFQAIEGKKLLVRDNAADPKKRKLVVLSRDPLFDTPLPGSADDPSSAGATLELRNPSTGETATFFLPPGTDWKGLGNPAGSKGWIYRDPHGENGPCKTLVAKFGHKFRATCVGKNGIIPFTLDESNQGLLAITVQLGGANPHCLSFGGDVVRDESTALGAAGLFIARNAPAGACPVP